MPRHGSRDNHPHHPQPVPQQREGNAEYVREIEVSIPVPVPFVHEMLLSISSAKIASRRSAVISSASTLFPPKALARTVSPCTSSHCVNPLGVRVNRGR